MDSLFLYLRLFFWDTLEYGKVVFKYYRHVEFAVLDLLLVLRGWVDNPFRVASLYSQKQLPKKKTLSSYTYGETPLTVFGEVARLGGFNEKTTFFECGAGRGRIAFFARLVLGCKVVVLEKVPHFSFWLKRWKSWFNLTQFEVQEKDFLEGDYQTADVIYLYGTTLEEEEIRKWGQTLQDCKKGTVLVTISWFLNEFLDTPSFSVSKEIEVSFPWGKTRAYFQIKD